MVKRFLYYDSSNDNFKKITDSKTYKTYSPSRMDELCTLLNDLEKEINHLKALFYWFEFNTSKNYDGSSERFRLKDGVVYDLDNHYGQYNRVLDLYDVVLLLNCYYRKSSEK